MRVLLISVGMLLALDGCVRLVAPAAQGSPDGGSQSTEWRSDQVPVPEQGPRRDGIRDAKGQLDGPLSDRQSDAGPPCPPGCGGCPGGVCQLTCSNGCACPAGLPCKITCNAGGCGKVDCSKATSCSVQCGNGGGCQSITCGSGPCMINCGDGGGCDGIDCGAATSCDVTCGSGCFAGITCGKGYCSVRCGSEGGCNGTVNCAASCGCAVECPQYLCPPMSCPQGCLKCKVADNCDSCP